MGLRHFGFVILSRHEESVQDIVHVRGHEQLLHRQPHSLGVVAGQHVTKVTRRNGEAQL